jgi:hypothetical protein
MSGMAADISVGIAVQGEKEFNKALRECQNTLKQLDSGLKANAAEFGGNESAMRQSKERFEMLTKSIEGNERIIESLGEAIEWSTREYGAASTQTTKYVDAQNKARIAVAKLKKELEDSDNEMEELGRDSARVGRQLENGIGEAAEDVSRKFDGMVQGLSTNISGLGKTLNFAAGFSVAGMIVEGAANAYNAVTSLVDASMDYNRQMSFLEVNAAAAGYSFEKIQDYAIGVAAITGDMDAAIEGMSMLLKAGFEGEELATAVQRLSGIIVQMPDGMKFENLAESLLESVSTGSAVGQYAEYLEKMGMNIETVNKALEAAKKNGQEAAETAALALLSGHGAEEVLAQWQNDNADMVAYFEAQERLAIAQADLAKELTPLATDMVTLATDLVKEGTSMLGKAMEYYELLKKPEETFAESEQVQEARENLPGWDNGYITGAEEAGESDAEEYVNGVKKVFIEESANLMPTWEDFGGGYETGLEEKGEEEVAEPVIVGADERFIEKMPGVGKDAMQSLANGVNEYGFLVVDATKNTVDGAIAEIKRFYGEQERWLTTAGVRKSYGPVQQGATDITTVGTSSVVLNLDGRELGRTGSSYIGASMGLTASREEMYGP